MTATKGTNREERESRFDSRQNPSSQIDKVMLDARLTEDLLDRLLRSNDIGAFLDEGHVADIELTDYLHNLLEQQGLTRADVARASGLNPTVVYDLFSGKSRPGRDNAIILSIGLNCDLQETQRLLRLAGVSELWCKQRRDAIIIWCVNKGYYRGAIDHELIRFNEKPLMTYHHASSDNPTGHVRTSVYPYRESPRADTGRKPDDDRLLHIC